MNLPSNNALFLLCLTILILIQSVCRVYGQEDLNVDLIRGNLLLRQNESAFAIQSYKGKSLNFTIRNSYIAVESGTYYSLPKYAIFQLPNGTKECSANCSSRIEFSIPDNEIIEMKWSTAIELCMLYRSEPNVYWFKTFGEIVSSTESTTTPSEHNSKFIPSNVEFVWINSNGLGIMFNESVKLNFSDSQLCFVSSPQVKSQNESSLSIKIITSYGTFINDQRAVSNLKTALQSVRNDFKFGFLSSIYPDIITHPKQESFQKFFTKPFWSYNGELTREKLLSFALPIEKIYKFNATFLEINSNWQKYDGDFEFDLDRSMEPKMLLIELHKLGWNISLPINPFINELSPNFERFKFAMSIFSNGFVIDENVGGMLNLSRKAVSRWFKSKLTKLSGEFGIDAFQFGGRKFGRFNIENLNNNTTKSENQISAYFYGSCSNLHSPSFPLFVQIDIKANRNNFAHNLKSLIPMVLSMSLAGHTFIVPNLMIDDETEKPSAELYIRWVQAVALMPVLKFSIVPWTYNQTVVQIAHKFTALHEEYGEIMSKLAMEHAQQYNEHNKPIIRPLWYVFSDDVQTNGIEDQFMLGDDILVAPVIQKGQRERQVYFPKGVWIDPHDNAFTGPGVFNVSAPLDQLPYFKLFEALD